MSLKCGEAIEVRDLLNTTVARYMAQCDGRFLLITYGAQPFNGMLLMDWRAVLRQLVGRAVPAKLQYESAFSAQSMGSGLFRHLVLAYPLPVSDLAGLLDEDLAEVRAVLNDLAVQTDG